MKTIESKALGKPFWHGDDHIRTEQELNDKLEGLIKIYKIFISENVKMFLSAGTMLGAVRDHDFIPWDWNVSVVCLAEEFNKKLKNFCDKIISENFVLTITQGGNCFVYNNSNFSKINLSGYIRLNCYFKNHYFQIENLILKGKFRTRPRHKISNDYFIRTEYHKIRGINFPTVSPSAKCLEWYYGKDWRIPKKIRREKVINKDAYIMKKDKI